MNAKLPAIVLIVGIVLSLAAIVTTIYRPTPNEFTVIGSNKSGGMATMFLTKHPDTGADTATTPVDKHKEGTVYMVGNVTEQAEFTVTATDADGNPAAASCMVTMDGLPVSITEGEGTFDCPGIADTVAIYPEVRKQQSTPILWVEIAAAIVMVLALAAITVTSRRKKTDGEKI